MSGSQKRFLDQIQMEHSQRYEGWNFLLGCGTVDSACLLSALFSEDVALLLLGTNKFLLENRTE